MDCTPVNRAEVEVKKGKEKDGEKKEKKGEEVVELKDEVDLDQIKLWMFASPFEEYKILPSLYFLFMPAITIFRNIILSIILCSIHSPLLEIFMLLILQCVYYYLFRRYYANVDVVCRYKENIDQILVILFIVIKTATICLQSEYYRQEVLGLSLSIIILLFIFNSIWYSIYLSVQTLKDIVLYCIRIAKKWCCCKDKDKKRVDSVVNSTEAAEIDNYSFHGVYTNNCTSMNLKTNNHLPEEGVFSELELNRRLEAKTDIENDKSIPQNSPNPSSAISKPQTHPPSPPQDNSDWIDRDGNSPRKSPVIIRKKSTLINRNRIGKPFPYYLAGGDTFALNINPEQKVEDFSEENPSN
jgi:hypothetical protein